MRAVVSIEGKSYDTLPSLVRGDYGWDIKFTITYNDDSVANLTGATVKFKMKKTDATTLAIDATCTAVTALTGIFKYTVASGAFATIGAYEAELEVTTTLPGVYTIKLGKVQIVEDLVST